jgi:hypothetical protein
MIDAEALRKQAANKYPEVVEALLRGENPFPVKLRYARIKTTDARDSILRDIATLTAESREQLGHGLTVEWMEINTLKYGRNRIPDAITIATEEDFVGYVGKCSELSTIRLGAETLVTAFPGVRAQIPGLWRVLRDGSQEYWQQVVKVLEFFRAQPFPDRYIRELPVAVPTKFIEDNCVLLERLIRVVAPLSWREGEETFEERLGLKTPDALIECRLLDDELLPAWRFRQFTVGLNDLKHLDELPAHTVIITENRTNFLTLPPAAKTIALQGHGYAVSRLRRAPFLKAKRILYWGDLDEHGFEILAVLRREFGHAESLMMDAGTWEQFAGFRVAGVHSRNPAEQFLPYLRPEEAELFKIIASLDRRLEQERIPQDYVNRQISKMLCSAPEL